tara:strand:- start:3584 stop:4141 length:558 start_codon:yes stop_codon:yes gene_type:complete
MDVNAQLEQVKFIEASFENGMIYPVAVVKNSQEVADKINEHLQTQIEDLKNSDFCIGQYGYIQKGAHIQIHIFCNCIDFEESQNRYFLYNIETGDNVLYSDLFIPQKIKHAVSHLLEKTKSHASANNITLSEDHIKSINDNSLDAFKVTFKREGMDLWLKSDTWGDKPLFISWSELKTSMKYSFI